MILKLMIGEQTLQLEVPDPLLTQAEDFFAKMDKDMDGGWQISREWVQNLSQADRCLIAADKLHSALHADNQKLAMLMAAYILKNAPGIEAIDFDLSGELQETVMMIAPGYPGPSEERLPSNSSGRLSREEATDQAQAEISKVYKSGRKFRYSVKDPATEQWVEIAVAGDEAEANRQRDKALEARIAELCG